MGKKKKRNKKHSFKHQAPNSSAAVAPATQMEQSVATPAKTEAPSHFSYVSGDLRRVTVITLSFVVIQLLLWWAFTNTGLGPAVYRLISI